MTACGTDEASSIDCERFRFSAKAWSAADAGADRDAQQLARRRELADGLVTCNTLQGRTEREMRTLLGKPHIVDRDDSSWLYLIGPERAAAQIDTETLVVTFVDGRADDFLLETG